MSGRECATIKVMRMNYRLFCTLSSGFFIFHQGSIGFWLVKDFILRTWFSGKRLEYKFATASSVPSNHRVGVIALIKIDPYRDLT